MAATFIADGSTQWKVVYSSQTISSGSKGTGKDSSTPSVSVGVVPFYYVWGTIKSFYTDREVCIELHAPCTFSHDQNTSHWNFSAWDQNIDGYPEHVTFYQNRLVFSGTRNDAFSVYLSEYEDLNSFSPDGGYGQVDNTKALAVGITDDALREIRWVVPMGSGLLIGCDSALWFFCIDLERGFNVAMRKIYGTGVSKCPPVAVGDSILFVCGSGRTIKAVTGSFEQGFQFTDLTEFGGSTDQLELLREVDLSLDVVSVLKKKRMLLGIFIISVIRILSIWWLFPV